MAIIWRGSVLFFSEEGKAFVEFDCEGFEFSGENFEVEDVTNFEILEEGSLDFNPEDITERDEEELDIT